MIQWGFYNGGPMNTNANGGICTFIISKRHVFSSGTPFGHGQFEIKTFPIYDPPYCTCTFLCQVYSI